MLHVQRIDQIHCEGNNVVSKCSRDKILTFLIIQMNKSLGRGFFPFGQQGPPLTVAKDLKKINKDRESSKKNCTFTNWYKCFSWSKSQVKKKIKK